MARSTIQKSLRGRRAWARLGGFITGIAGASAAARYGLPFWVGMTIFVAFYWGVTELLLGRSRCPRCTANLWNGEKTPIGLRGRSVWFDPRGLPDRCGDCGLDLTESSFADFEDEAARARWERGNVDRKTDGRRGRTFGRP